MADQKVTLKVGADTSELEKAFGSLIRKIQNDADKLKLSPAASRASPTTQANTDRELTKNKTFTDAQAKSYQNILKSLKEEYSILQQIGREREKQNRQEHIANIQKSNFAQFQRAAGWGIRGGYHGGGTLSPSGGGPSSPGGTGEVPKGGITSLSGAAQFLGVPAAAIGTIATVVAGSAAAETTRRFFAEASNRARVAESSAFNTQGQAGQRLQSFLNGGAGQELMFDAVRQQAAGIAQQTVASRYSLTQFGASPLGLAVSALRNPLQNLRRLGGAVGITGLGNEYQGRRDVETANEQNEQFEALKNGPGGALLTQTGNKFLRDWQRNLGFQRQTGFSEQGFRGFLGGVNSTGFNDEQGMGMSSAITGAGGSTRSARENAAFALQMQRSFGLTNAGQALGSISGQLGTSQLSKDALIRIQAEGTRIGLNQSEFKEENRKFVEMAASLIGQSNVTSGSGMDQIVSTLGRFMNGAQTPQALQAGQNAYQAYQAQSNVQSGPSATIRAAGLLKDPTLRKLSSEDQASLFTMNEKDVNPDDPGIRAMASKVGLSPQAFVDKYHGIQNSSLFQRRSTDMAISRARNTYQRTGPLASGAGYQAQLEAASNAEGQALNAMPLEPAAQGLDRRGQQALAKAMISGDNSQISRALTGGVAATAAAGQTGLPGDNMERQQAEAAKLANGLFQSFKDSITPASAAVQQFAQSIDTLLKAMNGDAAQRASALRNFNNQYPGMAPTTQPSSGPPTNGAGVGH